MTLLRDGERTAGAISEALRRPRPGVSYHLSRLVEHGVITVRREGTARAFSIDFARALARWNELLFAEHDPDGEPTRGAGS